MIKDKISYLRNAYEYSLEKVGEAVGVSAETVAQWEAGTAMPGVDNAVALAKFFTVPLDYLYSQEGDSAEVVSDIHREINPAFDKMHGWEYWPKALLTEYRQCFDEGKDVEKYSLLFSSLNDIPFTPEKDRMCDALFSLIQRLPQREGYPYVEPNTLDAIRAERNGCTVALSQRDIFDCTLGGWYGRLCGCLLGKPVEGMRSWQIKEMCEKTDNYPLSRYFVDEEIPPQVHSDVRFWFTMPYPKNPGHMVADDDTNYMLIALSVLSQYGRDFTSKNVAEVWLNCQNKYGYCTAERIAYKNFSNGFMPPESGEYKNAFREWIGAQIRADVFGYVNPCDAEAAAEMAWRDARISHVKNGIYGEMWVAAMLATAYGTTDVLSVIRGGLSQVPQKSRLYEAVEKICTEYEGGRSEADTFADIAARWDESNGYDWCHTVANAEIVAACLLYGEKDYGRSICLAVSQGFDTDCNGATVGSVLGVILGKSGLPHEWTDDIGDTLYSTLNGLPSVSITEQAKRCMEFMKK